MGKKKTIIISITTVICCWIFNIGYFYMNKLKAPVFIENYKEIEVYESLPSKEEMSQYEDGSTFEGLTKEEKIKQLTQVRFPNFSFFYITDNNEDEIRQVQFPELGNMNIDVFPQLVNSYNNHNLMSIDISDTTGSGLEFKDKILAELKEGKNKITKMTYYTRTGKRYEVNLGEIYFIGPFKNTEDFSICSKCGSGGSTDGTGYAYFNANRDCYITSIKSNIRKEIDEIFEINMNSTNINKLNFPYKVKKDVNIKIDYVIKKESYKSIQGNITLKMEKGEIKQEVPMDLEMNSIGSNIRLDSKFVKAIKEGGGQAHEVGTK
ncbi:hypothetical protein [Inconstantimicrobium mannanitabidum]|uniref:Uncharacterized protein n=1 Tax=Inconstantimicrobium mannanitabidum TaxID=1604901 RepID=A0ACB5RGB6_9CLOT|nr:hypothetical protein [Clostridium sp. TW13]GKX68119.1 hypothetical protein rsdtw13_33770 [Clostridium sp. TW13]